MPRRLLIITDEMEVGGTQRQIVELARQLDRAAYSVSLVYFRNGSPYVDELREAGVDVECIPKRWKLDPLFFIRLCRFIRRGEFDIVHGFSFTGEAWGWLANLIAGQARFISSIRGVYEWYSPLQWVIKRLITLNSAAVIANSQAGADYAAMQMSVRRNQIQVVHNGMRPNPALAADGEREDDGRYRVLFVGRLVGHKNIPCLLRGFAAAARQLPNAHLDIVGDGPDREMAEKRVAEYGIASNVTFHGERHDVAAFLRRADVFVCSSRREGLSNAIMEAMAAGVAVIASNVGGNSELVTHQETGLLFPGDDDDSLGAMLVELANKPDLRRQLAAKGRDFMRQFHDPARMAAETERIYRRCVLEEGTCVVER